MGSAVINCEITFCNSFNTLVRFYFHNNEAALAAATPYDAPKPLPPVSPHCRHRSFTVKVAPLP